MHNKITKIDEQEYMFSLMTNYLVRKLAMKGLNIDDQDILTLEALEEFRAKHADLIRERRVKYGLYPGDDFLKLENKYKRPIFLSPCQYIKLTSYHKLKKDFNNRPCGRETYHPWEE